MTCTATIRAYLQKSGSLRSEKLFDTGSRSDQGVGPGQNSTIRLRGESGRIQYDKD